jgi:hypothetical protein
VHPKTNATHSVAPKQSARRKLDAERAIHGKFEK